MPLDIGIGLILGVLLHENSETGYLLSLSIGVFAALLPDLDFVYSYIRSRTTPWSEHRDGLHYPFILTPIAGLLGWLVNPQIGIVLAVGVLLHFIHDSVGIGFGIKWLFPFKKNSYLFLFQIKTPTNTDMPKKRFYSWTDTERAEMNKKYGYKDWIRYVYLQPNPWGLFEYAVFLIGVTVAITAR